MMLSEWAKQWGISDVALADLQARMCTAYSPEPTKATSEAGVLARVRLEASRKGLRLWRNNLGATTDAYGNFIRYGLANESKKINDVFKSSDLIGIRPVSFGGCHFGQFVARECKAPGWEYTGTLREKAQLNFLEFIASMGGDACFCTGEGTL